MPPKKTKKEKNIEESGNSDNVISKHVMLVMIIKVRPMDRGWVS